MSEAARAAEWIKSLRKTTEAEPGIRQNFDGTFSHHMDSKRRWADRADCATDLRFSKEWTA